MRIIHTSSTLALLLVLPQSTNSLCADQNPSTGRKTPEMRLAAPKLALSQTVEPTTAKRNRRRRRNTSAPMVDSALLRFVSEQKRRQKELLRISKEGVEERFIVADLEREQELLAAEMEPLEFGDVDIVVEHAMETQAQNEQVTSQPQTQPASVETTTSTPQEDDAWMGQYNRNRVAQKLISLGADPEEAALAGEQVQSQVLLRTARQRVRLFLQQRDSLWQQMGDAASDAQLQDLMESKVSSLRIPHANYGLDEVIALLQEYHLTGKDICSILVHTPSVSLLMPKASYQTSSEEATSTQVDHNDVDSLAPSDETLEDTIQRSYLGLLQDTLGLRRYDARKVLRTCPGLLSVRGSKSAVQVVNMMTKMGVSKNSIARDKTSLPTLLSRSPAGLFRLISFLSDDKVQMPIPNIGPLIRRAISREVMDAVVPSPRLQKLSDGGDETDESMYVSIASLLARSRDERVQQINDIYHNMTITVDVLQQEVGVRDLGKMISANPSVLLLDVEETIRPRVAFLKHHLGSWQDGLPSVIQHFPNILTLEIEEMEKVIAFLTYLGVEQEDTGKIIRAFPPILTMNIEKDMTPVVDFLIEIGVSDIGAFVTSLPAVLGYSVEKDLRPKWEYLQKVSLQPTFEVNAFPAYFSYPFDRVIENRYEYLAAKGIERQLLPVDSVVRYGDLDFATKIARDKDGTVFAAYVKQRNDSQKRKR